MQTGSDFTALNNAITGLTSQVASTETTEAGAVTLINGFATQVTAAVTAALTADDAADSGSISAASAAIAAVTSRFTASGAALGAAITANTPAAPAPAAA